MFKLAVGPILLLVENAAQSFNRCHGNPSNLGSIDAIFLFIVVLHILDSGWNHSNTIKLPLNQMLCNGGPNGVWSLATSRSSINK